VTLPGAGEPRWTRSLPLVVAASLALVFAAGFSAARSTSFGGYDEWLVVSLTSRGIVSFPYANRPLALAWALPGALGLPSSLDGYLLVHAAWLLLSGFVVLGIARRLAPGQPRLAVLAAAFALTWVPLDPHRLNPLNNLQYSGATLAALVSLLLLLDWSAGRGRAFLAGAFVCAFLAVRSYEATLGLLAPGAAVLLLALGERRRVPARLAFGAWAAVLAALGVLVALPLVRSTDGSYQLSALGLSLEPGGVLTRLARQAGWHLGPLFVAPPLWSGRLVLAAIAAAAAVVASPVGVALPRRRLAHLAAAGLGLGLSAWSLPLLTTATVTPAKMQGLSAPGLGLMLAAGTLLAASLVPRPARLAATLVLACWVVALGTSRTLALQREWDERTAYPAQRALLGHLVALAPDLREGTLVLLLDGEDVFPATFTFRHAVSYLYRGHAVGLVHRGHDFLYPARFEEDGVASLPWPVVMDAWREPARLYGYDTVVVVRHSGGALTLEPAWPPDLPAASGTRSYAPLARLVVGGRQARVPGGLGTRP